MLQPIPDTQPGPLQTDHSKPGSVLKGRLMSMDAYRGFVMVLMAAELMNFSGLSDVASPIAVSGRFWLTTKAT